MASGNASTRTPVEERLFSLVLALLATDGGLTKAEILSTVQGYRQRYQHSGDNANLERQFERDKDDIRELGIPLETADDPGDTGNNQTLRYRIPRGAYDLPSDIRFSSEEITLLNLAGMVWREGSLSAQSRRAILKLRSLGVVSTEPLLGYAPRVRVRDASFEPLSTALEKRQVVRFAYLKPGQERATIRTVAPLALVQHQGRWHLFAAEVATGAEKTFLLRRIVSAITTAPDPYPVSQDGQAGRAMQGLENVWASHVARVEAAADSDASSRLSKRRDTVLEPSGVLSLHYSDEAIFADELAAFGPEVRVLEPETLIQAVTSRLRRIATDHG